MNKPARFTQAELARALRAAKQEGARVKVRDGVIEFDFDPNQESQAPEAAPPARVEPEPEIRL